MNNMYDWITKTKNFIRGECPHGCSYCYVNSSRVKHLYTGKPYLAESAFTSLGKGNFYFIGSMIDMWAEEIPDEWIFKVLVHCKKYDNKYLFQTKNPQRIWELKDHLPDNSIIGTTIETNRVYRQMGYTPPPNTRARQLNYLSYIGFKTIVTIEPIMNFDLRTSNTKADNLFNLIHFCNPEWVNIGADSKGHNLPEPSSKKIKELISALKESNIEVKLKSNLKRLLK